MALTVTSSLDDIITQLERAFPNFPRAHNSRPSQEEVVAAYWRWAGEQAVLAYLRSLAEDPEE